MKKTLFICLLINSFSMIFISYDANAEKDYTGLEPSPLIVNDYRLCAHPKWSHECGTSSFYGRAYGVRWTKKPACRSIGALNLIQNSTKYLSDLEFPWKEGCVIGN